MPAAEYPCCMCSQVILLLHSERSFLTYTIAHCELSHRRLDRTRVQQVAGNSDSSMHRCKRCYDHKACDAFHCLLWRLVSRLARRILIMLMIFCVPVMQAKHVRNVRLLLWSLFALQ